jgi:hypothetical protein
MSIESEMQTLVQKNFGDRSRWLVNKIGLVVLGLVVLAAVNGSGSNSWLIIATACLPMVIADVRQHHNKLAIVMLNSTLAVLVGTVAYSQFGGILMFTLVFFLSTIGWFVALVWSCTRVRKYQE